MFYCHDKQHAEDVIARRLFDNFRSVSACHRLRVRFTQIAATNSCSAFLRFSVCFSVISLGVESSHGRKWLLRDKKKDRGMVSRAVSRPGYHEMIKNLFSPPEEGRLKCSRPWENEVSWNWYKIV